jgi:hypothetical protein
VRKPATLNVLYDMMKVGWLGHRLVGDFLAMRRTFHSGPILLERRSILGSRRSNERADAAPTGRCPRFRQSWDYGGLASAAWGSKRRTID